MRNTDSAAYEIRSPQLIKYKRRILHNRETAPAGLFPLVDSVLAVNDFAYRENPHYLSRRPLSNSGFQP